MASQQSEQIQILNQITKLIDDKVTKYKKEMKTMPTSRFYSEKKIILDTIEESKKRKIKQGSRLTSRIKRKQYRLRKSPNHPRHRLETTR